ncbi:hypothetical protein Cch01nite_32880 [Cellulomonas chitinilytica]|uniref:Uncharacterized protein n=1 Tax=Cellulomonas chitinilytica TaxID=398759 RepID=A0A919P770_9CELL|nr:hypothetical protein [Cellulomonas chitinilytica]GIG22564.1 hypothetical protein Cch01nite_32880 [Cellulomonas chitinilytica]
MASSKSSKSRKVLAVGLAVLGVAGLSLASATQLNLNANNAQFQAGVQTVANCQPSGQNITVGFGAPTLTAGAYGTTTLEFRNVSDVCLNKLSRVALTYGTTPVTVEVPSATTGTTVALTNVTGGYGTLSVTLPAAVAADAVTKVALTIYS